jgi:hypothetical protein
MAARRAGPKVLANSTNPFTSDFPQDLPASSARVQGHWARIARFMVAKALTAVVSVP